MSNQSIQSNRTVDSLWETMQLKWQQQMSFGALTDYGFTRLIDTSKTEKEQKDAINMLMDVYGSFRKITTKEEFTSRLHKGCKENNLEEAVLDLWKNKGEGKFYYFEKFKKAGHSIKTSLQDLPGEEEEDD